VDTFGVGTNCTRTDVDTGNLPRVFTVLGDNHPLTVIISFAMFRTAVRRRAAPSQLDSDAQLSQATQPKQDSDHSDATALPDSSQRSSPDESDVKSQCHLHAFHAGPPLTAEQIANIQIGTGLDQFCW
jgi:hypothetical protein